MSLTREEVIAAARGAWEWPRGCSGGNLYSVPDLEDRYYDEENGALATGGQFG